MPDTLCPHDRLLAHCMWCLAEVLAAETAALAAMCAAPPTVPAGIETQLPLFGGIA